MANKVPTVSGNPYHDDEGQFTSKDDITSGSSDYEDIYDNIEVEESKEDNDVDIDDFDFELEDLDEDDIFDVEIRENVADLSDEELMYVNSLENGELEEAILSVNDELDSKKLVEADENTLREILKASLLLKKKQQLIYQNQELKELNEEAFLNIWIKPVTASDWLSKKNAYQDKLDYYKNYYKGEHRDEWIAYLNKFKEVGELYEQSYNELTSSFKRAEQLLENYIDKEAVYSQYRKNNAIWISDSSEYNKIQKSREIFGPKANQVISFLKKENPQAITAVEFYTDSYSIINEPLRREQYSGSKSTPFGFVKTVQKMTEAIDASTYDFDYWVQRSTSHLRISDDFVIDESTTDEELQSLIGEKFPHESFFSAGSAKGTGYGIHRPVMINTYCPRGTKGLYVNTGLSGHTSENEMILQRGYRYKIVKAEKHTYSNGWGGKNTMIYLDVECILGSDSEKFDDNELQELENKYIK